MKFFLRAITFLFCLILGFIFHPYFIDVSANELSVSLKTMSVTELDSLLVDQLVFTVAIILIWVSSIINIKTFRLNTFRKKLIPWLFSISGALLFWQLRIAYLFMERKYYLDSTYDLNVIYVWKTTWLTEFFFLGVIVGFLVYFFVYNRRSDIHNSFENI